MLRQEVCRECGVTKKALKYYEEKHLIEPRVLENGYRDYGSREIAVLKEISVLRKCGMNIADIKTVLDSPDKKAALSAYRHRLTLQEERLEEARRYINELSGNYDIDGMFDFLQKHTLDRYTLKEKLMLAFPGWYGMFLSLHFGRFLEGTIETEEQSRAYRDIVGYLDRVEFSIPPELADILEPLLNADPVELEQSANDQISSLLANPSAYLECNRAMIARYLEYRLSEEFQSSPAGQLQQALMDFQRQSGYQKALIENMKILSPSYRDYLEALEAANQEAYRLFPESKNLYKLKQQ